MDPQLRSTARTRPRVRRPEHRRERRREPAPADGSTASRSRLDNASLRFLDAGVILVAWLLAYLAGFEGSVPQRPAGRSRPVPRAAARHPARREPARRALRTDLALRVGRGGGACRVRGRRRRDRVDDRARRPRPVLATATLPVFTTPPVAALLVLLGCGGIRFQARLFALERQRVAQDRRPAPHADRRFRELRRGARARAHERRRTATRRVVGFIDDDPELRGRSVRGVRVLGTTDDLEQVCETALDRPRPRSRSRTRGARRRRRSSRARSRPTRR